MYNLLLKHQKPWPSQGINFAHPLARGLVGCWVMNEGAGSTVRDASGKRNDLSITSGASWCLDGLDFSGAVQVENTACTNLPTTTGSLVFTVSLPDWNIQAGAAIELSDNSASDRVVVYISANDFYVYIIGGGSGANVWRYNNPENAMSNNVKYDFVFTFDTTSDAYIMYKDGLVLNPTEGTGAAGNPAIIDTINLGSFYDLSFDLTGTMDFCKVYNRILTASEIAQLHREPNAMFEFPTWVYSTAGVAAGLSIPNAMRAVMF